MLVRAQAERQHWGQGSSVRHTTCLLMLRIPLPLPLLGTDHLRQQGAVPRQILRSTPLRKRGEERTVDEVLNQRQAEILKEVWREEGLECAGHCILVQVRDHGPPLE